MLRRLGMLFLLALGGLSLTGFSIPVAALAEEEGNPWWAWADPRRVRSQSAPAGQPGHVA